MSRHAESVTTETLDFLRGVAAVYVLVNHTRGAFFKGGKAVFREAGSSALSFFDYFSLSILQGTSLGTEFVILFFCVSGIAMAHSMASAPDPLLFYRKRMIRIWPPFIAAVAFAVALCYGMGLLRPDNVFSATCAEKLCSANEIVKMVFYINPSSSLTPQFWSLPYEVLFYIFCPIILFSEGSMRLAFACSVGFALVGLARYGVAINPSGSIFINFLINELFWFLCGAIGFYYYAKIPRLSPIAFWTSSACLIVSAWSIKYVIGYSNFFSNFVMICFTLLAVRNLPAELTRGKLRSFGAFSYSIYVFHYAILVVISFALFEVFHVRGYEISSYWAWIVFLVPTLMICWLLYLLVEKPCNDYLRRLRAAGRAATQQISEA
ncbi:acyltransferase [Methylosinus sp. Sm6]|uniref:acyltransferase family protein n=1 Tax=Methylosinus sp. Sm6 TaxID=2866948 RepID=UPI001C999FD2|nr:acyltransferase [Methylosinus sp. Sm6]MBY6242479.1 acyltransferase [Methylosinus sp. Sm6]